MTLLCGIYCMVVGSVSLAVGLWISVSQEDPSYADRAAHFGVALGTLAVLFGWCLVEWT